MQIKDLPAGVLLSTVKVKVPNSNQHDLPRRNYYYVYSVTGFSTWIKTSQKSDRVYPIQMMSSQVLNLKVYKPKTKKHR